MRRAGQTLSACLPNIALENLVLRKAKVRTQARSLRKRAETMIGASPTEIARMPVEQVERLVHELQIHQIELNLQNEELRQSQAELAESRDRFNDLYDFAPVGYLTLDRDSAILQANLTAASMLGLPRTRLIGRRLTSFVTRNSQDTFYLHQQAVVESGNKQVCEVVLQRPDGATFPVQVETVCAEDPSVHTRHWRSAISDITVLKQAEDVLRQARDELEKHVEARTRQECAVAALSRAALGGRDIERLLHEAVTMVAQVLGLEFSKILELTPSGDEFVLRAGVGWPDGRIGLSRVPARGESQASYTLQTNEPVLVDDLSTETRFRAAALLRDHSVTSGMSVVIEGPGRPYGILSAHTAFKRSFNVDESRFLQSIADVLAEAITRKQLEEKIIAISDREQTRVAYDLHDELCQQLAGIEFRTAVLADKLAGSPKAREEAEMIGALLRDSMEHARGLSHGLAPVNVEPEGLMSALDLLARNCGQLYGVDCQFHCDRPVLIGARETATHLYRIAQEAINNAIKHGHAKRIVIDLRNQFSETLLTITNDGLPLPADWEHRGGMGLQIMHYRADMIGATLRITSDGKTTVVCALRSAG